VKTEHGRTLTVQKTCHKFSILCQEYETRIDRI